MCGTLLLVVSAMCIETRGYLYSYYTQSFVSNQNNILGMDSEPLLFTMRVPRHYIRSSEWGVHEFEVVRLGHHKSHSRPKHLIEMNVHGEARLKLGNRCEAVYNGRLSTEKCSPSARQAFIWIPEHLFSDFVERLRRGYPGHYRKRPRSRNNPRDSHAKGRHRAREVLRHRDRISHDAEELGDVRKTMKVAKTLLGEDRASTLKDKCDSLSKKCIGSGGKYGHIDDKIFNNYLSFFCKSHPISGYCKNRFYGRDSKKYGKGSGKFCISEKVCKEDVSQKKEPFIKRMQHRMEPILDQKFIKSLTDILKSSGGSMDIYKDPIYESKAKRPRVRGIFARGEDSSELSLLECRCKFECVRNPNNGMCYYKADPSGKLIPIMSDESCCSNKRKDVCNIGNKLDKYLCELTIKNDYSSFSKFLDLNYACS